MFLGLHEERRNRRRRIRYIFLKWIAGILLVAAAGLYAYEFGAGLSIAENERLVRENARLSGNVERQRQIIDEQKTTIEGELLRVEEWRKRYERDVPPKNLKPIYELAQEKINAGVEPSRLIFLIEGAENTRSCDERPVSKKLYVKTHLYQGANSSVSFANNAITITAEGEAATDAEGRQEQWWDQDKPVSVRFTHIGGKVSEATGRLPLHHSIVAGDKEYRFTVTAANKGYAMVSGDRCLFP
ncbi:MAG: hypothetical protein OEY85_12680 [Rhodospirillales bacterium]|nr:hypothetical protein [Rhodospirillales bacterium]